IDSVACAAAAGRYSYNYYNNRELIANIIPGTCHYDHTEGNFIDTLYYADFYREYRKQTFKTKTEAMAWMNLAITEYYKPVVIAKWKKVSQSSPAVFVSIPEPWSTKTSSYDGVFESTLTAENKLTVMYTDYRGSSEIMMIIRTPNTEKLSIEKVLSWTNRMNPAVDLKTITEVSIGGKTFKSSQNSFMQAMNQWHFWYADDQEIIYINYNLLKDENVRYPEVLKEILKSITW
ncbi:MAG TPA: hypothetical protein DCQ31_10110, partial [Bacteroidales bacterium]|nr:hypothetical protein [Bacteroidales bacterium]